MKNNLFLTAVLLAVTFTSCEDEPIEPVPTPTPEPTVVTYNDFVIICDQPMDSVVFTNNTNGTTEHIVVDASQITCSAVESELCKFHLSHTASTGNSITVKAYHNAFTWGTLPFTDFLANSTTVYCDMFGGNSGHQTDNGNSTTFTFTAK